MEAVASVFTLLQATAILVKASRDLSRKVRNAPADLHALTAQLLAVQYELERIRHVSKEAHSDLLIPGLKQDIHDALIEARDGIASVDAVIDRAHGNEGMRAKVRWVRKDRAAVETAMSRVRGARDKLALIMQVMTW